VAEGVQFTSYGEEASVPREVPFAKKATWAIDPSTSLAFALTLMGLPTVQDDPFAGAVRETVGGLFCPQSEQVTRVQ
jgi:hypothetical protein